MKMVRRQNTIKITTIPKLRISQSSSGVEDPAKSILLARKRRGMGREVSSSCCNMPSNSSYQPPSTQSK